MPLQAFCRENAGEHGWYRSFVAASYTVLWQRYKSAPERHFYEVRDYPNLALFPFPNTTLWMPWVACCLRQSLTVLRHVAAKHATCLDITSSDLQFVCRRHVMPRCQPIFVRCEVLRSGCICPEGL